MHYTYEKPKEKKFRTGKSLSIGPYIGAGVGYNALDGKLSISPSVGIAVQFGWGLQWK